MIYCRADRRRAVTKSSGGCLRSRCQRLCRFGEFCLNLFLIGEQLLDAGPLLHPLEMRRAMLETRLIEAELRAAPEAPEEMGISRREVIEEEFPTSKHTVGHPEFFEELF